LSDLSVLFVIRSSVISTNLQSWLIKCCPVLSSFHQAIALNIDSRFVVCPRFG